MSERYNPAGSHLVFGLSAECTHDRAGREFAALQPSTGAEPRRGGPLTLLARFSRGSLAYVAAGALQRGVSLLLLPLYTICLAPEDYGVLGIVTALNGALTVLLTWSLHGAVTRCYFDYRDDPDELRTAWGTILGFMLLLSLVMGGLMLWAGQWLLRPILGSVEFWPCVALGVITSMLQPFFGIYLSILQVREQAARYATMSVANFLAQALSIAAALVFLDWGAAGPLLASAAVACGFFVASLVLLRNDYVVTFQPRHLRNALAYSLPLVPHSLAGQTQAMMDRLLLNGMAGPAAVGVYQVAYMLGAVIGVVGDAVNRAYVPVAMSALADGGPGSREQLRDLGLRMVAGFCLIAASVGVFSAELVALLAAADYADAARLVPLVAFAFCAAGIYYVFVNILFYLRQATRYVMVATLCGLAVSVALSLALVPRHGSVGAALALLAAQCVTACVAALVASRVEVVQWPYGRILLCYVMSFGAAAITMGVTRTSWLLVIAKAAALALLYVVLNVLFWGRANHLFSHWGRASVDAGAGRSEAGNGAPRSLH